MLTALLVGLLQVVSVTEDQPWFLDAGRALTLQKVNPGDHGAPPEVSTSVLALPHPFHPTTARVLRPDGTAVRVRDGLGDVGREQDVKKVVSWHRRQWLRVSGWQWGLVAACAGAGAVAVAILVGAAAWSRRTLVDQDLADLPQLPAPKLATVAVGPVLALVGGTLGAAALLGGVVVLRSAFDAVENAWNATAQAAAESDEWPPDMAAQVVQEHNRRVLRQRQEPPPETPGMPPVIPS